MLWDDPRAGHPGYGMPFKPFVDPPPYSTRPSCLPRTASAAKRSVTGKPKVPPQRGVCLTRGDAPEAGLTRWTFCVHRVVY